jgi:putative RNA 2'-phosphotransferase
MDRSLVKASKFLSLVLRHDPGSIGITLDEAGWVEVDALLAAARRSGVVLDRPTLDRIVADNGKKRFAFSDDGTRIRASQGHSVAVDLGLAPQAPPEILFHGTATRSVDSIRQSGLRPGSRTHVHLSRDEETAVAVGQRHGKPVVLRIAAGEMHRAGHELVVSENGVWLARAVPVEFIAFPDHP